MNTTRSLTNAEVDHLHELTFRDESRARAARRQYISQGARVSLIAFDGSRDVYAFDLYRG